MKENKMSFKEFLSESNEWSKNVAKHAKNVDAKTPIHHILAAAEKQRMYVGANGDATSIAGGSDVPHKWSDEHKKFVKDTAAHKTQKLAIIDSDIKTVKEKIEKLQAEYQQLEAKKKKLQKEA
jgi:hypothetical protein